MSKSDRKKHCSTQTINDFYICRDVQTAHLQNLVQIDTSSETTLFKTKNNGRFGISLIRQINIVFKVKQIPSQTFSTISER